MDQLWEPTAEMLIGKIVYSGYIDAVWIVAGAIITGMKYSFCF